MKIVTISDTHQHHKKLVMPEGDLLIHSGDFSYHGEEKEVRLFLDWMEEQDYKNKILILGNHETGLEKLPFQQVQDMVESRGIRLLHNSWCLIEGYTIYGTPYVPTFGSWAYMEPEHRLAEIYSQIPDFTDILITHGPQYGVLDKNSGGLNCGSHALKTRINQLNNLKLHVFGHIHESRGLHFENYLSINAAICGIPYSDILYNPITIEI